MKRKLLVMSLMLIMLIMTSTTVFAAGTLNTNNSITEVVSADYSGDLADNQFKYTYVDTKETVITSYYAMGAKSSGKTEYTSDKIIRIILQDTLTAPKNSVDSWDASSARDESVMAWVVPNAVSGEYYDLYLGSDGKIIAPYASHNLFAGYRYLTEIVNLSLLDTSNVHSMQGMFRENSNLVSLDVSNFNTTNVTDMRWMFSAGGSIQHLDVSSWNTSNVTTMNCIFASCTSLKSIDVSKFDTSSVQDFSGMFYFCTSLKTIDVKNFDTSSAKSMVAMFAGCSRLTYLNLRNFDTSALDGTDSGISWIDDTEINKNVDRMFYFCSSLKSVVLGKNFTRLDGNKMFAYASRLSSLIVENPNIIPLATETNIAKAMNIYLSNPTIETLYEKDETYLSVFGVDRIKSILGVSGNNPTSTYYNKTYVDAGPLVAGFDNNQKSLYEPYGYTVITSGMPVDTTTKTDKKVTYTIFDSDGNELMSVSRTVTIKDTTTLMSREDTSYALGAYNAGKTTYTSESIKEIHFVDTTITGAPTSGTWDVSHLEDGSIIAWVEQNASDTSKYDLYIGSDYTICLPADSSYLFSYYSNCSVISGLENIDTQNVTDFTSAFRECNVLETVDVGNWNTENVTSMRSTFYNCYKVNELDVSKWVTTKVTDMGWMFYYCKSLESIDVSGFDTTYVTNMKSMFNACELLKEIDVSSWNTGKVLDMSFLFYGCIALESINVSEWNLISLENATNLFDGCSLLERIDVSNWNVSNISDMHGMFQNCIALKELDVSKWVTTNVTDMGWLFYNCESLESIDVSDFDTTNVTNMRSMFNNCELLKEIDVSSWNVSKVENTAYMFADCYTLETLNVSSWNTSKILDMGSMFSQCYKLKELDVSKWVTTNVTNMGWLFYYCESLESLNLLNFDTSSVTNMRSMFSGCKNIKTLNLRNFNTSSAIEMHYMFSNAQKLQSVLLGENFDRLHGQYIFSNTWVLKAIIAERKTPMDISGDNMSLRSSINLYVANTEIEEVYEDNEELLALFGVERIKPLLDINGSNPATIALGKTYVDAGPLVAGFNNLNSTYYTEYGYYVVSNGDTIDTTTTTPKYITYTLYDSNNVELMSLTRTVNIMDTGNLIARDFTSRTYSSTEVIEEWERQVIYTSGNKAIYTYYALGAAKANQTKYTANLIKEIHFIDTSVTEAPTTFEKSWDVSENQDGSMTAWIVVNSEDSTMYDLYIGSMLKMSMPAGSAYFFAYYINCTEITGLENLDTSNVTAMNQLFYKDRSVEELNVGSWDVSNVTSLYSTFCYCESLTDLDISSWDVGNVTTMRYIFAYCYDLQMLDLNEWNTEKVTFLNSAFNGNSSLTAVYVSNWNTARVTDMSYMFNGCTSLVTADVSNWNTDEVTNLNSMFYNCNNLEVIDVSNWNTAKVTSMRFLFNGCKAVTTLDLGNWNTAKVTDFSAMFYDCTKVTDLDVSNFNTSSAKVMALMFNNCDALTKLDLRSFDTSALDGTESGYLWTSDQTNCVNVDGLLNGCENIQSIVIGDKLSRLDGRHMFSGTNSLSAIIVTKNISSSSEAMTLGLTTSLNTNAILYVPSEEAENAYENATNYSEVFGADRIKPILEVKGLNPMTVLIGETYDDKKDQGALVAGFSNLNQTNMYSSYGYSVVTSGLPISTSTESSGKIVTYVLMYKNADSGDSEAVEIMRTTRNVNVVEIPLLMEREYSMYAIGAYREYINTSDETYLNYKAELINKIVLTDSNIVPTDGSVVSSWDVSYAYGNGLIMAWITESTESSGYYDLYIGGFKEMLAPVDSYGLFRGYKNCSKIEGLEHMDTSQVTDMGYMFYDCMRLKTLDLTSFNTVNVTNMCSMFYKCWELENLKISNLNTSNVEDMSWMFMQCYLLKEIDLTGIDTSNVKDMSCMFDYCTSLTGVDVSGFNTSNVINMAGMFYKCTSLLSVDVSNFDTSKVESMGGMFFRCNKLTALDLGNFDLSSINNTTGNNILLEDGSYGVNLNEMFYDCTKLELLILGSKFDKINGSKMFYNTTALKKIITERNISSSNDAMTLSTNTELSDVTTLYVLSLTAEEAYENATNYNDVFGTERIKPILELNGINPVIVAEGVIYSVAKDAGVLVAGYSNILESNKYDSYGYSVRTTGLPITTTALSSNVVTYTLMYKAEESGDADAVDVMSVTRTINGRDTVASLTETKNGTATTKHYLSLADAISESSNKSELDEGTYSEITMMQDEELTETLTLNNKKIRLNTNGNDIFTDNSDNSITSTIIMFKPVSSIFAIKDDASEKGKISLQGGNVSSQIIESTYSDIIIEGGSLEVSCDNWSIAIKASSGTVNVKDGDIVAQVPSSGTAYALEIGTQAVVNVSGGDISAIHNGSGTARAIQNWNSSADSTLVVSGGMLSATSASGTPTAIYSTGATVLINGGTLKANSTSNTATALDNTNGVVTVSAGKLYAESNNSAVGIMDYNNEVIIDGTAVIETNAQSWSIPIKISAGKLNLKNGDLLATTTNGFAYGVELSTSSEMQMTGGTINVTATGTGGARGIQNWNNISGKVLEISGGIIEAKAESGMAIGIYSPNDVGTTNIIAGKIIADSRSGYAHGVYVTTGDEILTIGSDLDNSTKETPIIMGKTYGVYSKRKFIFYDGTLKGQSKAYYGEALTQNGIAIVISNETIDEVVYEIATLREACYIVGDTNYATLTEAFNAAESGDTITVIKDVKENTTGLVAEGKSLVFDLNGHEVSFEGNAKLEVKGNLNISGEGSIVKINNTSEAIHITYTGTLTLGENEGTVSADELLIKSDTVAIVNEGTLNFYDGRVSAIEDPLDGKVTVYVSGYHLVEKVNGDYTEIYLTSNDVFIERWDISLEAGVDNVYAGIKVLSGDGISEDTTYVLEVGGTGRTKDYTFEDTNDVTYPYKVTTPWHEKYWQSIVELELEEGVTEYNALLFAGLASINSIELPNSLTAIGKQAFRDMEALNCSVMIPSNVTTIGENPFIKTPITEFKVESDNTTFVVDNGVLYDNVAKRLVAYPSGKEETTYTIKTDTKVIGVYAFLNENEIKEVILPEGLETIDGGAFQATGLEKITIPNSVNEVSWFAFASSSNLKYVYFKSTSSITISSDNSFSGLAQDSIIYTESKAIAEMFEPDSTYTSSTTQVYYPFTLTSELPNQELERGDTLTFAPTIEEGFTSDDVIYQWYLNDVAIDGANEPTYTKAGFDTSDAGEYKLVIKSAMQENGEYYYTVESNVAKVVKVDLTGPSSINTSVEYKEDGTATITVTTADTDSGISSIRINDERIEITKNEATSSATGKFTVSTKGEYEIRATDGLNNSTSIILNAYEVTYNSNAAVYTGTTAMQIKIEDAPITLHENGFKRVGYTFQNWNTASDATGLTYTEGATYSENANVTLYAVWQARKYTVRFYNDNGIDGEYLISEKEYNYGDLITVPGVQERIGELVDDNTYRIFYHNNTWKAEKEDQESIDSVVNITDSNKDSITMIDSNVNYYATYATKDFSNTSGTTIINGKSEVSGTTYGILNELGLVIIGNNSVANSVPTISGDTTMAAIVNNGGLLLWYMGELHGPVQGLVVQK